MSRLSIASPSALARAATLLPYCRPRGYLLTITWAGGRWSACLRRAA